MTSSTSQPLPATFAHAVLHLASFEGGNALSEFRLRSLLPRLQAVNARIQGVQARFVHLVSTPQVLPDADREGFERLLTYGEPAAASSNGPRLWVGPRLGTVSPWASKATDIAHNCGMAVRRIERLTLASNKLAVPI